MVEPGDVRGLEQAIRKVLDGLAGRLARSGRAHVTSEFSSDALALRYAGIYERALDRKMCRRHN